MNKKKIIPIVIACAVVLITGVSTAFAWLFAGAQKTNEITAGDQSIVISENNFSVVPNDIIDNPIINKDPVITNNGNTPCYIRAYVGCNSFNTEIKPFVDKDEWTFEDGYYYYKNLVNQGESVTFFRQIEFVFDGTSLNDSFDVFIYAESVESDGSVSYADAWAGIGG